MQTASQATAIPNPQRAIVEAQNARRVAQRAAAASLATSVGQTGRSDLQRGPRRQVGGTFEQLQTLPSENLQVQGPRVTQSDIERFLSAFRFSPQEEVLAQSRVQNVAPRGSLAPGTITNFLNQSTRRSGLSANPFSQRTSSLGGLIVSPF